jgi:hypothetical protein
VGRSPRRDERAEYLRHPGHLIGKCSEVGRAVTRWCADLLQALRECDGPAFHVIPSGVVDPEGQSVDRDRGPKLTPKSSTKIGSGLHVCLPCAGDDSDAGTIPAWCSQPREAVT